jgi:hypothetical protein
MNLPAGCKARQFSDQMLCECGLAWDVNDPDPPECLVSKVVLEPTPHEHLERLREGLKDDG